MNPTNQIKRINEVLKQHCEVIAENQQWINRRKKEEEARKKWWSGFWNCISGIFLATVATLFLILVGSELSWHWIVKDRVSRAIASEVAGVAAHWQAIKDVGARAEQINEARHRAEQELNSLVRRVDKLEKPEPMVVHTNVWKWRI